MKFKKIFVMLLVFSLCFVPLLGVSALAAPDQEDNSGSGSGSSVSTAEPLYQTAYDLFRTYIYGADTVLTEHMELTLTLLATIAALFVVLIPFFVVFISLRFIFGR